MPQTNWGSAADNLLWHYTACWWQPDHVNLKNCLQLRHLLSCVFCLPGRYSIHGAAVMLRTRPALRGVSQLMACSGWRWDCWVRASGLQRIHVSYYCLIYYILTKSVSRVCLCWSAQRPFLAASTNSNVLQPLINPVNKNKARVLAGSAGFQAHVLSTHISFNLLGTPLCDGLHAKLHLWFVSNCTGLPHR